MVYETDPSLDSDLGKYGCAFLSLAHYNPNYTDSDLNRIKNEAQARGILDDEDTVLNWQMLVDLFAFPLKYRTPPDTGHWPYDTDLSGGAYFIGEWYNAFMTHFVVMDNMRNVIYDPIQGGSNTVKNGHLVSFRIFDAV